MVETEEGERERERTYNVAMVHNPWQAQGHTKSIYQFRVQQVQQQHYKPTNEHTAHLFTVLLNDGQVRFGLLQLLLHDGDLILQLLGVQFLQLVHFQRHQLTTVLILLVDGDVGQLKTTDLFV